MGLKDRANMVTFVLWKDHYGFNMENGLEKSQLFREAGQEAVTAFLEFWVASDACLEQSSDSEV